MEYHDVCRWKAQMGLAPQLQNSRIRAMNPMKLRERANEISMRWQLTSAGLSLDLQSIPYVTRLIAQHPDYTGACINKNRLSPTVGSLFHSRSLLSFSSSVSSLLLNRNGTQEHRSTKRPLLHSSPIPASRLSTLL